MTQETRGRKTNMNSKISIVAVLMLSLSIIPMIASVQAQSPDFSLTPTSFSLLFQQGIKAARTTTLNVTGLNGFTGFGELGHQYGDLGNGVGSVLALRPI